MSKFNIKVLITQIIFVIMIFSLWELGAKYNIINPFIFSSPSKIFITLKELLINGQLLNHILITLKEIIISFTLGITIAFIVSIIMYLNKFIAVFIDPFLTLLNSLPKVALGPIIIIWIGANNKSIITMALLINVFISIITIYSGFSNIDKDRIKLFDTFRANKYQKLFKLVIPESRSSIMSALKVNISLTFIGKYFTWREFF